MKPLKAAIVGTAPSSRDLAPFNDAAWEIWGVSNVYSTIPKWDRWFELHDLETRKNEKEYPGHYDWLKKQTNPVYMQQRHEEIPGSIEYPKQAILNEFGTYFTNSVSYMLALAIHEGAEEIGIYGVDMAVQEISGHSEYAHQRPSCEYFVGLARGKGIKVEIPKESDLLKTEKLYAYETAGPLALKARIRLKELQGRIAAANKQEQEARDRSVFLQGAADNLEWIKTWV